jgi:hypothetical protein
MPIKSDRPKYSSIPARIDTKDVLVKLKAPGETMDELLLRLAANEHVRVQQLHNRRDRLYAVTTFHPKREKSTSYTCWPCFTAMHNLDLIRQLHYHETDITADGWIYERFPLASYPENTACSVCRKLLIHTPKRSHRLAPQIPVQ